MNVRLGLTAIAVCLCVGLTSQAFAQGARGESTHPRTPEEQEYVNYANMLGNAARKAFEARAYSLAETDARQAIAMGDVLSQETLAETLYREGKTDESLREFANWAVPGIGYPRRELPVALMLLDRGEWEKAVAFYNGAIPRIGNSELLRDSFHFTADVPRPKELAEAIHLALGFAYSNSRGMTAGSQDDLALTEYEQAIQMEPKSALANYYYGYGLLNLHRTKEAGMPLERALNGGTAEVKAAAQKQLKLLTIEVDQKAQAKPAPK